MELAIGVTIRQLLLHLNCSSEFEAPGDAGVSAGESLLGVPNDMLRARLWLVGHQVLLSRQITVAWVFGYGRPSGMSASKYRLSSYGQSPHFSCSMVYT